MVVLLVLVLLVFDELSNRTGPYPFCASWRTMVWVTVDSCNVAGPTYSSSRHGTDGADSISHPTTTGLAVVVRRCC